MQQAQNGGWPVLLGQILEFSQGGDQKGDCVEYVPEGTVCRSRDVGEGVCLKREVCCVSVSVCGASGGRW